jgi:hypothetical protein
MQDEHNANAQTLNTRQNKKIQMQQTAIKQQYK